MTFNNVVVVGGETLGSQIAFMSAFHGKNTTIWGRSDGSLDRAKARVARWEEAVKKDIGATDQQVKDAEAHLHYTTDLKAALKGADLVVEALSEDPDVKNDFYKKFSDLADPDTVIVTNTSTLLPSEFADATGRPEKYLGYHFANSIWKNNTAEIMSQSKTSKDLPKEMEQFSREIGMVPILVNKEQPGYLLNSLLVPFLSDALVLWNNGVSDPETINRAWMIGTGAPLGPFAIMDSIGMKTMYDITKMSTNPEVKKASEKFKTMIDQGKIGRESGKGFYTYPDPDFKKPEFLK
ncbi:3-hydroxyacyl-CoA dehydrogenase [Fructilactobacillus fructivorans]|uniref:3-hydroxyacyl-CoA dehydrogenase n=1 Tax=Fructilactobacillus fructivorans TaxID=1614 RepID=UPI000704F197|nr:3-hydroxyacyl-CoA dehydrogenase [Fructilactobacillus fructivorans]KRN43205.1 3-hydroxybutyryl-CoA dehydrogenase [Fructilactobacillus fructivorans]